MYVTLDDPQPRPDGQWRAARNAERRSAVLGKWDRGAWRGTASRWLLWHVTGSLWRFFPDDSRSAAARMHTWNALWRCWRWLGRLRWRRRCPPDNLDWFARFLRGRTRTRRRCLALDWLRSGHHHRLAPAHDGPGRRVIDHTGYRQSRQSLKTEDCLVRALAKQLPDDL